MSAAIAPIRAGAVCRNSVQITSTRASAICHCCGRQSRAVTADSDGEPDLFELARGWSMAPYPAEFVHADGSVGSTFTCPECNARLRSGESLTTRANLRVVSMEEQRRMAMQASTNYAWGCVRREIDRAHLQELQAGVHA